MNYLSFRESDCHLVENQKEIALHKKRNRKKPFKEKSEVHGYPEDASRITKNSSLSKWESNYESCPALASALH